jgi:hypothetical protein
MTYSPSFYTDWTRTRTSSSRLSRLPSIDESWYQEDMILLSYVELQRLHVLLLNKMNFVQDYIDDLKAQVEHEEKIKKEKKKEELEGRKQEK